MKSKEKIDLINDKVTLLNNNVLKKKKWQLKFDNKGANMYCIVIIEKNKEIWCSQFGTFDNVINCLLLLENMFSIAMNKK